MYLTVLKHGDSATLDTMLKVKLAAEKRRQHIRSLVTHSCRVLFVRSFVFHFAVNQLHKQADMQEEKNRIERVLGAISAPDLIQKVLSFALSVPAAHLQFGPLH